MMHNQKRSNQIFDLMDQTMAEQMSLISGIEISVEHYIEFVEHFSDDELNRIMDYLFEPDKFTELEKDQLKEIITNKWYHSYNEGDQ